MNATPSQSGFNIVEIAIVMAVIGLLVGGTLGGMSLMRASELRSVATDVDQFKTGINAFQSKYQNLPGDIDNATSFWGAGTANGNANGQIEIPGESFRAWQHLTAAGLMKGQYTGTHVGGAPALTVNVPESRVGGGAYMLQYIGPVCAGQTFCHTGTAGNGVVFGALRATLTDGALLSTQDAFDIDSKVDDGYPDSGSVTSYDADDGSTCISGAAPSLIYAVTVSGRLCALRFQL